MILKKLQQVVVAAMVFGLSITAMAEESVNELVGQGDVSSKIDMYDFLIPIGCGAAVWSFAVYRGGRPADPRKARLQFDLPIFLGVIAWIASSFLP